MREVMLVATFTAVAAPASVIVAGSALLKAGTADRDGLSATLARARGGAAHRASRRSGSGAGDVARRRRSAGHAACDALHPAGMSGFEAL
jgi:hypothetical protein